MNAQTWYVLDRGKVQGPFSIQQLETMQSRGVLTSFSKISQDRSSWVAMESYLRDCRARESAPLPSRPPPLPSDGSRSSVGQIDTPAQQVARLREAQISPPLPLYVLLLLHYLTVGIFTFFWTTGTHGALPRLRSDDPSAGKAIGLCLVPLYNLYWFFVVYPRLAARVNAVSVRYGMPVAVPLPLPYLMCICLLIPAAMATAGTIVSAILFFSATSQGEVLFLFFYIPNILTVINLIVIMPVFAAMVQAGMNRIFLVQVNVLIQSGAGGARG
jgi:hypothetical protein